MEKEKKRIREKIQKKLQKMSLHTYEKKSQEIANTLFHSSLWKKANTIAITVSRKEMREVNTYPIILKGWEENKKIVVPRSNFKTRRMSFHIISHLQQLEERSFHLKEPRAYEPIIPITAIDLMIVPGIAYTKKGDRLGFGGGFYDRFLQGEQITTVALAFSCQVVSTIPMEKHDQQIDHMIGPRGFYL